MILLAARKLKKPVSLGFPPLLRVVGQGRLELPTSRLSGVRSNHLSYWPGDADFAKELDWY